MQRMVPNQSASETVTGSSPPGLMWYILYDSHRHNYAYCSSVFTFASICTVKVLRKIWLMGMNTSDSRPLREMGLLIVGFYWLLYTPFASIYSTGKTELYLQLVLTEMGQEGYVSRKIAHKCCFRWCCRITVKRDSRGSHWKTEKTKQVDRLDGPVGQLQHDYGPHEYNYNHSDGLWIICFWFSVHVTALTVCVQYYIL